MFQRDGDYTQLYTIAQATPPSNPLETCRWSRARQVEINHGQHRLIYDFVHRHREAIPTEGIVVPTDFFAQPLAQVSQTYSLQALEREVLW